MRVFVEGRVVTAWLKQSQSPWLVNLPWDFRIVECQADAAREGIVFTVWSSGFRMVARGRPIPEMYVEYNGLKFLGRLKSQIGLVKRSADWDLL